MRKLLLLITFFTFTPIVLLAAIVNLSYYSFQKTGGHNFIYLSDNANVLPISYAALPTTDSQLVGSIEIQDGRVLKLKTFLHNYHSVLEDNASLLVEDADKYGFDYRLLPAIAAQESMLCKTEIANTYNCWGWGITKKQTTSFTSYAEAIDTISRGFAKNYIQRGRSTPELIGPVWNPTNTNDWIGKVDYFIGQINTTI